MRRQRCQTSSEPCPRLILSLVTDQAHLTTLSHTQTTVADVLGVLPEIDFFPCREADLEPYEVRVFERECSCVSIMEWVYFFLA